MILIIPFTTFKSPFYRIGSPNQIHIHYTIVEPSQSFIVASLLFLLERLLKPLPLRILLIELLTVVPQEEQREHCK